MQISLKKLCHQNFLYNVILKFEVKHEKLSKESCVLKFYIIFLKNLRLTKSIQLLQDITSN